MANNTTINTGTGGDVIRDIDRSGVKTQVVQVDLGGSSAESLLVSVAKGTQGAAAVPTQSLNDSGRVIFSAATVIAGVTGVTTEALVSMVPQRGGTAAGAATTFTVTSGKTLRLTNIFVGFITSTSATVTSGRFSLRMVASGTPTASSTIVMSFPLSFPSSAAALNEGTSQFIDIPGGLEFSGTMSFGISQVMSSANSTIWVSVLGYEY